MRTYDNTKLSTHRDCARRYYFRHVRNWVTDGKPAIAPGFGIAIHSAMDAIWNEVCVLRTKDPIEVAQKGYQAFEASWLDQGFLSPDCDDEEQWKPYRNRRPDVAASILIAYVKERWSFMNRVRLLEPGIEVPFLVPIDPDDSDLMYMGRKDKIYELDGGIWIHDHKTTANYRIDGGFAPSFLDGFSPDSQLDGYAYSEWLDKGSKFRGVMIDGILVHKTQRKFCLVPVMRDHDQMAAWIWEARREIQNIEKDIQNLNAPAQRTSKYMTAFPKNTHRCFDFFSPCAYLSLCKMWSNPHAHDMPLGYKEEEWNPVYADQLDKGD